ncbi:DUF7221 family queuine tRNA-ribosyltransferase-like protein [Microvirga massiliensis]|uniref:deazapurine DNA modification protein DpdA family protein n=1 Tax=Microvirga massiliensis TaxID=1033741 RepID=UPI00065FB49E|nr:hypothetical protein [Microvirga massiliensis]
MSVDFYVGIHQPSDAHRFHRVCISIHRLMTRRKPLGARQVFIDSGAFSTLDQHGGYPHPVEAYARRLWELHTQGTARIVAASAQDYMCERSVVAKLLQVDEKDLTAKRHAEMVRHHQQLTIERYDLLLAALEDLFEGRIPFAVIPVLQGYNPEDYQRHIRMYGCRLTTSMWVGVGSVCKRNGSVADVIHILAGIKGFRPDLRLHGFGLKKTALKDPCVRALLYSADSMAWSLHAFKHAIEERVALEEELGRKLTAREAREILRSRGIKPRSANDWREAAAFVEEVESVADLTETHWQMSLPLLQEAAE